jgi:hypothetical protein
LFDTTSNIWVSPNQDYILEILYLDKIWKRFQSRVKHADVTMKIKSGTTDKIRLTMIL